MSEWKIYRKRPDGIEVWDLKGKPKRWQRIVFHVLGYRIMRDGEIV